MGQREEIINKIVDFGLKNAADLFLELEGEFYPFGIIMDKDASISPFYNENDSEFPDSNELIQDLRKSLKAYLLKYNSLGAAICYLASKKIDELEFDLLVLELFFRGDPLPETYYFIIEIEESSHTFIVHEKIDYGRL
jgi:hypothetical protein